MIGYRADISGQAGATIKSSYYKETVAKYSKFSSKGAKSIPCWAVDSRGTKKTFSPFTFNVLDYYKPFITYFSVVRKNNGSTAIAKLKVGCCAILEDKNNYRFSIEYKNGKSWETCYSSSSGLISTTTNNNVILQGKFSIDESYDFRLIIRDKLFSKTASSTLPTATVVASYGKKGMAIGGILNNSNHHGLQVSGQIIDENGNIYLRKDDLFPKYVNYNNGNFNNLWEFGEYVIPWNSVMKTWSNRPCDYAGWLVVRNLGFYKSIGTWNYVYQRFLTYEGSVYIRRGSSGDTPTLEWTKWKKVEDGVNF